MLKCGFRAFLLLCVFFHCTYYRLGFQTESQVRDLAWSCCRQPKLRDDLIFRQRVNPDDASRRAIVASVGLVMGSECYNGAVHSEVGGQPEYSRDYGLVIDDAKLLKDTTGAYLNKLLVTLEETTGAKARILCPPPRLKADPEKWKEYLRPIYAKWKVDQGTLCILAEVTFDPTGRSLVRSLRNKAYQNENFVQITMGYKMQERFQYVMSNNFLASVENHFSDKLYIKSAGTDAAIRETAENVVAAIYTAVERVATRKKGSSNPAYQFWIPPDDVSKILAQHSV